MTSMPLACPSCDAPLSSTQVLAGGSVSLPDTDLIRFDCPRCGAVALAKLGNGQLQLGAAGGDGRGAGFHSTTVALEPDLFVRKDEGWIDCWYGKFYRRFRAATP